MIGLGGEPSAPTCSRAGCPEGACWRIEWRNPRIHTADRVKIWLACDGHREFLRDYLASREFPVQVLPFDDENSGVAGS
jgi:hypothetical protein